MKYIPIFFFITFSFGFLFIPETGIAQAPGLAQLAQCTGNDCTACNLVHLANGVIRWVIGILFVVFAVLVAIAGIRLVISGGNSRALDDAKETFINAIIGLIIILSAWLIIDTLMRTLVGNEGRLGSTGSVSGWLFWSEVECQTVRNAEPADVQTLDFSLETYPDGSTISETGIPAPTGGPGPISTPPATISGNLVSYAGAQFDSGIVANVQYIATTFGLRVSGGYRTPERNAAVGGVANSYHLTGRAADFVGTQAQMEAGRQWARNNGAREALIHNAGSGTHLHVAW